MSLCGAALFQTRQTERETLRQEVIYISAGMGKLMDTQEGVEIVAREDVVSHFLFIYFLYIIKGV